MSVLSDERISGVVFPIIPKLAERIVKRNNVIFVKYVSRVPKKPSNYRLEPGMRIYFYVSGSHRKLAGQGIVRSVEFLPYKEVLAKYGNLLLLTSNELSRYSRMQPNRLSKPMLVLGLGEIRRYPDGVVYHRNVTMAGEYVRADDYTRIESMVGSAFTAAAAER